MAQAARRTRSRKRKTARKHRSGASWGMLLIGLVSGSVLAVLMQGAYEGTDHGFGSGLKTLLETDEDSKPTASGEKQPVAPAQPPKPTLDFYTVLPKIERVISEPAPAKESKDQSDGENVRYVLQVAAYENFNEADRLKAELTLTGFDARIQKVTIGDKGVYYRVRLGPYQNKGKLAEVEQKLLAQGIRGMSLRVTDP